MPVFTFTPKTSDLNVDWDDPTIWSSGTVPNGPDADVVIPETGVPGAASPNPGFFRISINSGESYAVASLSIAPYDEVSIAGALSVAGKLSLPSSAGIDLEGGSLSVGDFRVSEGSISGSGTLTSQSAVDNDGFIYGSGLTLKTPGFGNPGTLVAGQGGLTIDVTRAGGFADLSGGSLTGGTYEADGGLLQLGTGGAITTDDATIDLEYGGSLETVDPNTGSPVVLQTTLQTIGAAGCLCLTNETYNSIGPLTIDGRVSMFVGRISAPAFTIAAGGSIFGDGTISGPIEDDGTITSPTSPFYLGYSNGLEIDGPVSGAGRLVIGPPIFPLGGDTFLSESEIQLDQACSTPVVFTGGGGGLILADPQGFSGTITPAAPQSAKFYPGPLIDAVYLGGITLSSVTGTSYAGNSAGGTLTISEGASSQHLTFIGDFSASSFALSAEQAVGSAPGVEIAITPLPSSPTVSVADQGSASGVIIDTATPAVTGTAAAGTTVSIQADGIAIGSGDPQGFSFYGGTTGSYQATLSAPLAPGAHQITAIATNSAGSTAADPVPVFVLPTPVDGIVTAAVSSSQISALLGEGYTMSFSSDTQAIQLTNGTLSIGTDTGAAYMQRLYEGLLGRSADTGGLVGYNAILNRQGPVAVASDILASAEFAQRHGALAGLSDAQYVTLLYQGLLGRAPEAASLANDTAALAAGVSRGALATNIATSGESADHFAAATSDVWVPNPTNAAITQLYETGLDRAPDLAGLAGDVHALVAGATLSQIADSLAASPEFLADHARQSAAQIVTSFYANAFGRAPDPVGLQVYTQTIQSGGGTGAALLAIATSAEATRHLLTTPYSQTVSGV